MCPAEQAQQLLTRSCANKAGGCSSMQVLFWELRSAAGLMLLLLEGICRLVQWDCQACKRCTICGPAQCC